MFLYVYLCYCVLFECEWILIYTFRLPVRDSVSRIFSLICVIWFFVLIRRVRYSAHILFKYWFVLFRLNCLYICYVLAHCTRYILNRETIRYKINFRKIEYPTRPLHYFICFFFLIIKVVVYITSAFWCFLFMLSLSILRYNTNVLRFLFQSLFWRDEFWSTIYLHRNYEIFFFFLMVFINFEKINNINLN